MIRSSRRRRGRVTRQSVATTVLATVMAGSVLTVAHAYFRSGGAGLGLASTDTVSPVTLTPGALTDQLYPGDSASVAVTVTNPNPTDLRIGSLVLDTTQGTNGFARASGSTSCTLSSFSFTPQTNDGDGWSVDGGDTVVLTLTNAVSASVTTPSACQNVVLTVYLKAAE